MLRARYWDGAGVEVKELAADPESIENHEGVWVVTRSTMRNLRLDSWTRLEVSELEPNPDFDRHTFEVRRLEGH